MVYKLINHFFEMHRKNLEKNFQKNFFCGNKQVKKNIYILKQLCFVILQFISRLTKLIFSQKTN